MRKILLTVVVLTNFISLCVLAQGPESNDFLVRFSSKGINDELSQGFVPVIFQDHRGFMWFATKDGLNKYDGYHFTVYRHDANDSTTIADNFITNIFEDSRGYLWLSPPDGEIDVFSPETETFYHIKPSEKQNGDWSNFSFMTQDAFGNIWFMSRKNYFEITMTPKKNQHGDSFGDRFDYSIHPASEILSKKFPGLSGAGNFRNEPFGSEDELSFVLRFDYSGNMWFTKGDSLYEISKEAQVSMKQVHRYDQSAFCQLPQSKIFQIISDSTHHHLYFISTSGLSVYNVKTNSIEKTSALAISGFTNLNSCSIDREGNLWLNCNNQFFFYSIATNQFRKVIAFNTDNNIEMTCDFKSVLNDRNGIMWVGTNGFGVYRFNPRVEKFHKLADIPGLIGGIRGIKGDNEGRVYVYSAQSNELLNPEEGKIDKMMFTGGIFSVKLNGEVVEQPITFVQDASGIFWLGYGHGALARYDETKNEIKFFHLSASQDKNAPTYLWLDHDNDVWMLAEDTTFQSFIIHFNRDKENFDELIPFPEKISVHTYPFVSSVQMGSSGEFWFGTLQGLFCYHPATKQWSQFKNIPRNKNSLSYNMIFSLCADPKHPEKYLWIGTNSGGLNRLDITSNSFVQFTDKDGLPNNVIYGILPDNSGNLWLSTNKGLCRFNPETKECTNYYVSDGLQGNEFNRYAYYKSKSGELFFGGVNGLNFFYPEEISSHVYPPPIVFTDFRLFNKSVSVSNPKSPIHQPIDFVNEITLAHNQNMITLEFDALDFTAPEKNRYKYKLDGFDQDWISSGTQHVATYTNLDPGAYIFNVKAANSEGVWNEEGRTIRIVVTPPWWQTWWTRIIFIAAAITAIALIFRYRTARLRRNQKNLEQKVDQRTKELNESLMNLKQTQDQLVQQEKLASLGQLTAGIAHEIRNPLNFVNNFAELSSELISEIKNIKSEEERNEILTDLKINVDKIAHHGKRADSIVKNMLDHSRSSSGEKQLTDINQLSEEFLDLAYHGRRASQRDFNCTLYKHFDPKIPSVNVVTQDISRVLLNLFNNAFDAVYDKQRLKTSVINQDVHDTNLKSSYQPLVSLATELADHHIIIKVKDNGYGIPSAITEKIFEPFFTTKPTGKGTGLGLSISYDIVKAHGGEMKVDSKENEFTEFTIVLPA